MSQTSVMLCRYDQANKSEGGDDPDAKASPITHGKEECKQAPKYMLAFEEFIDQSLWIHKI